MSNRRLAAKRTLAPYRFLKERKCVQRRVVSTLTATLVLALSVAVPLLERADAPTGFVVESAHDPASCLPTHDHTICAQVGANQANPAVTTGRPGHTEVGRTSAPPHSEQFLLGRFAPTTSARAPPKA